MRKSTWGKNIPADRTKTPVITKKLTDLPEEYQNKIMGLIPESREEEKIKAPKRIYYERVLG